MHCLLRTGKCIISSHLWKADSIVLDLERYFGGQLREPKLASYPSKPTDGFRWLSSRWPNRVQSWLPTTRRSGSVIKTVLGRSNFRWEHSTESRIYPLDIPHQGKIKYSTSSHGRHSTSVDRNWETITPSKKRWKAGIPKCLYRKTLTREI